jgi:hypothetical protein
MAYGFSARKNGAGFGGNKSLTVIDIYIYIYIYRYI